MIRGPRSVRGRYFAPISRSSLRASVRNPATESVGIWYFILLRTALPSCRVVQWSYRERPLMLLLLEIWLTLVQQMAARIAEPQISWH